MKPVRFAAAVLLCALCASSLIGCSSVSKVRRTLALNDLHTQAAIAEDSGDDQTAYDLWSEYVERRPQSALAEYRLGRVETRLELYEQAVGHLRIAHDLHPGNIEYLEALADTLVLAGRTDALMELLQRTLEEGEDGAGYLRLARYSRKVGMMDEAREALLLAIARDRGQSPTPYLAMADFAHSIGDKELEIKYLRHVLWFDPARQSILTRLDQLGMIPGPSLALAPESPIEG